MRAAVVVFPGTNCEFDAVHALRAAGADAELVWHRETSLDGFDGVLIPGGFAHGDYLRTGAIAGSSPVMEPIRRMASNGRPVLGICNGFQVLCEAGLLPGGFIANRDLSFICRWIETEVVDTGTVLTAAAMPGQILRIPLNSYEGAFVDPSRSARTVIRYVDDPNGSQDQAAAVANEAGNVVGIMPHPERATEEILGSTDGCVLVDGFVASLQRSPAGV